MTAVKLRDLSIYLAGEWQTKGRLIRLDPCRHYANDRGSGDFLTFRITDETGFIEGVVFGPKAQQLSTFLVLNEAYSFSNVRVDRKKPQYCTNESRYQLRVTEHSTVSKIPIADIPERSATEEASLELLSFTDLDAGVREGLQLNVMGVLVYQEEAVNVASRTTGAELLKSHIVLENEQQQQITINLWNAQARPGTTLTVGKAIIACDFHGELDEERVLSLTSQNSTVFHSATEYPEGQELEQAVRAAPVDKTKIHVSRMAQQGIFTKVPYKLISTIGLAVMRKQTTDYFRVVGIVTSLPYPPNFYKRCPVSTCSAKVESRAGGQMQCTKCAAFTHSPAIGLTLVLDVQDYSGSAMMTLFNETAAKFAGHTLRSAKALFESNADAFAAALAIHRFKYHEFRVSISMNTRGVYSAKCWSVQLESEAHFVAQLQLVQDENKDCLTLK